MKRRGGNTNVCVQVEEGNEKRLHAVRFRLRDILEKAKLGDGEKISGCRGLRGGKDDQAEHRGVSRQQSCSVRHRSEG